MKKYILFVILMGFFIFFQSTPLYENIGIRGVQPDFILITLCAAAYMLGPMTGQIVGFIVGMVIDIISGGLIGISAFTYTIIGYGVGAIGSKLYGQGFLTSAIILFFATLIKATLLSLLGTLFLEAGYFGYFTQGRAFLEAILNCFIAPILFFIIMKVEQKVMD
jgi:rod shape-determining protein MreD